MPVLLTTIYFTPTAGPGTHLWERDKWERERGRKRKIERLGSPGLKLPNAHYISTWYLSWSASQPNKCGAPFGVFSEALTQWDTYCQGNNAEPRVWVHAGGQKGYRQHSVLLRVAVMTQQWQQRGSNRVVQITTPGITAEVQLLSLGTGNITIARHTLLNNLLNTNS